MPLSEPSPRTAMHHRQVSCRGYLREDGLWDIEGHLVDVKDYDLETNWRGTMPAGAPVHDMWLRITIDEDLLIHDCEAAMDDSPYDICPEIVTNFRKLKGLRIQAGWNRDVNARVGGTLGCTHLVELLRPLATTAFQTLVASKRHSGRMELANAGPPRLLNTCHAHADFSPVTEERWPAFFVGRKQA